MPVGKEKAYVRSQNAGSKWRVQVWEGTDRAWRLGGTCTREQLDAWGAASRNSFRPSLLIKIFGLCVKFSRISTECLHLLEASPPKHAF